MQEKTLSRGDTARNTNKGRGQGEIASVGKGRECYRNTLHGCGVAGSGQGVYERGLATLRELAGRKQQSCPGEGQRPQKGRQVTTEFLPLMWHWDRGPVSWGVVCESLRWCVAQRSVATWATCIPCSRGPAPGHLPIAQDLRSSSCQSQCLAPSSNWPSTAGLCRHRGNEPARGPSPF